MKLLLDLSTWGLQYNMQQIIQENEHFKKEHGDLLAYHHFSFGEYHNPEKMQYGPLRVFNDDTGPPGAGFDFHPHNDMEIVTYVIEGELEHKDNQGNQGILKAGGVQQMSAGTGVMHSEFNNSKEKPIRALQLWFLTKKKNVSPSWHDKQYTKEDRLDKLLQIISSDTSKDDSILKIHQDVKIYVSSMTKDTKLEHKLPNRIAYLFVIKGEIDLNGDVLKTRDAVMIDNEDLISFTAKENTELILLDLPIEFEFNQ